MWVLRDLELVLHVLSWKFLLDTEGEISSRQVNHRESILRENSKTGDISLGIFNI